MQQLDIGCHSWRRFVMVGWNRQAAARTNIIGCLWAFH